MGVLPLGVEKLPKPLSLRKLIGPSFIILGVGLGSGELILWPYLASNFGLGIIWAAILGITFQFFINMEIERYTLARGESVFVGFTRKWGRVAPFWFILTTIIPWLWPGIVAASGVVLARAFGIPYSKWVGIILLLVLGGIYALGKVIYKTQERVQKAIIFLGVPFIFLVTVYFANFSDWGALLSGLIGRGDGYWFFPEGLPFSAFLAALAYSGAGGNLNLAQSLYIREKGYGMAAYAGKITGVFSGERDNIKLEGAKFELDSANLLNFKTWWRRINIEHLVVFWFTGVLAMVLLSLLAYSTVYGDSGVVNSINFILLEAGVIGGQTFGFLGTLFLIASGVMLFGTQFSILGSNSRIATENLALFGHKGFKGEHLRRGFYGFLVLQIMVGILIFMVGFTEPLGLVIIGAILNGFSMFIYSGLILWLNMSELERPLRPSWFRVAGVVAAFLFYGFFSVFTILRYLVG